MTLNLGCGMDKIPDAVNVDNNSAVEPDVLWNLDVIVWPFRGDTFDEVIAQDVIEHVARPLDFVKECWRVLKTGGVLRIRTPHWTNDNSWIDPTHLHHLHQDSFDYFDPSTSFGKKYSYYSEVKFRILEKRPEAGNIIIAMEKIGEPHG